MRSTEQCDMCTYANTYQSPSAWHNPFSLARLFASLSCSGAFDPLPPAGTMASSSGGPAAKRPRAPMGGHRQRIALAEEAESRGDSKLSRVLMERWAWGDMSAPTIQTVAQAALEDGAHHRDLRVLASLGSNGRLPGNAHRDLERKLAPNGLTEAVSKMMVTMRKPPAGLVRVEHPVLWPHEIFAAIFRHYPAAFQTRIIGGDPGVIGRFWDQMEAHPAYAGHPLRARGDHKQRCIPLALHGDGVPVAGISRSWAKSVDIWSWTSILGKGSTKECYFLIYLLYWKYVVRIPGQNLYQQFSKRLAWSLYWLFVGRWPSRDWDERPYEPTSPEGRRAGQPLAGGYYGVLWCVKGDLEHMHKAFGLQHHGSHRPCSLCQADTDARPWTDGRPGAAAWMATVWTPDAWILAHPQRHEVFQLPGVTILNFVPDVMHTMYLGTHQYVLGSILKLLTHEIMPETPERNLEVVWTHIREYYREHRTPSQLNDLRVSMYFSRDRGPFPSLKAKAAEVRHLLGPMLYAFNKLCNEAIQQHQEIRLLLEAALQMEAVMDGCADRYSLPPPAARQFREAAFAFMQLNTSLAHHYHPRGIALFHCTIKFHYLLHLGLISSYMSPKVGWCFGGEDFMQRIKSVVQASQRASGPHLVVAKTIRKYVQGMGLGMMDTVLR